MLNVLSHQFFPELTESEYVFGRDHYSVDVVLKHSSVDVINFSKKHFTVGFNGANREAYIIDNSTNGTFVGSERLPRDVQHNLLHLSRISVISEKNKGKYKNGFLAEKVCCNITSFM